MKYQYSLSSYGPVAPPKITEFLLSTGWYMDGENHWFRDGVDLDTSFHLNWAEALAYQQFLTITMQEGNIK